jgi:hypothetical protein
MAKINKVATAIAERPDVEAVRKAQSAERAAETLVKADETDTPDADETDTPDAAVKADVLCVTYRNSGQVFPVGFALVLAKAAAGVGDKGDTIGSVVADTDGLTARFQGMDGTVHKSPRALFLAAGATGELPVADTLVGFQAGEAKGGKVVGERAGGSRGKGKTLRGAEAGAMLACLLDAHHGDWLSVLRAVDGVSKEAGAAALDTFGTARAAYDAKAEARVPILASVTAAQAHLDTIAQAFATLGMEPAGAKFEAARASLAEAEAALVSFDAPSAV